MIPCFFHSSQRGSQPPLPAQMSSKDPHCSQSTIFLGWHFKTFSLSQFPKGILASLPIQPSLSPIYQPQQTTCHSQGIILKIPIRLSCPFHVGSHSNFYLRASYVILAFYFFIFYVFILPYCILPIGLCALRGHSLHNAAQRYVRIIYSANAS